MSSLPSRDEPANCTPASEGGIAVFPADAADIATGTGPARSIRVGPLVSLAVAFGLGIAAAPALPLGPGVWAASALVGLALAVASVWARRRRLRCPTERRDRLGATRIVWPPTPISNLELVGASGRGGGLFGALPATTLAQ